jgi:hypothetical protein
MHADRRRIRRLLRPAGVAILATVAAMAVALVAPSAEATTVAGVLIDETFGAQTTPANFGFPAGAAVSDGVLNVTKGMSNYTTSVKAFDAAVVQQRTLDVVFQSLARGTVRSFPVAASGSCMPGTFPSSTGSCARLVSGHG